MTFEVFVHDTRVATLSLNEAAGWVTDWDPVWVAMTPRPIVSLKLLDLRLNRPRAWGARLPPFLTNLLPEVDSALRRRLARTHGFAEADDVAFLSLLGGDLSGAIRVVATEASAPAVSVPRPPPPEVALSGYRASLGGMQLKFSAHRQNHITLPAHGELSEWILKLPAPEFPRLPAWEAAALSWAAALGFAVPEHHVEPIARVHGLPDDVRRSVASCLVVRRFDRPGGERRVHMEEAASILGVHPEAKYGPYNLTNVGRVVSQFAGAGAAALFVERVVFDAVMGNGDAHLKNWALVFPDGLAARLAPVYDLVPTTVFLRDDGFFALAVHGSRPPRPDQVRPHDVRDLARRIGLDPDATVNRAADLVRRAVAAFDAAVEPWGLPADDLRDWKAHAERVARGWA